VTAGHCAGNPTCVDDGCRAVHAPLEGVEGQLLLLQGLQLLQGAVSGITLPSAAGLRQWRRQKKRRACTNANSTLSTTTTSSTRYLLSVLFLLLYDDHESLHVLNLLAQPCIYIKTTQQLLCTFLTI
jgi:hypothetical protein